MRPDAQYVSTSSKEMTTMSGKKPFFASLTVGFYNDANGTSISKDEEFELNPAWGQTLLELLRQQAKDGYKQSHMISLAGSALQPDEDE
jgi:hypothetical protein